MLVLVLVLVANHDSTRTGGAGTTDLIEHQATEVEVCLHQIA